jgi:hypothetical protein
MEEFKGQKAELTEEQKILMSKFEEKRKERLDDAKSREPKETETHKSTTIFHGINTDYGSGKGFIEPPAYLR